MTGIFAWYATHISLSVPEPPAKAITTSQLSIRTVHACRFRVGP
ncbi:MAG TPA: hypothetical protein VF572_06450 [Candidatus Saccharimonadales bacterium]